MGLLTSTDQDRRAQAAALARASAQHNLGSARTLNMPTLPLELAHPRHRSRMAYQFRGGAFVNGMQTVQLDFQERQQPTLVRGVNDEPVWTRGSIWIEAKTARLWRAHVWYGDNPVAKAGTRDANVRVEFGNAAPTLGVLVPVEMREEFYVARGSGSGVARYSNFRRFETSARIVPQP